MFEIDTTLFLWLNANAQTPHWVLVMAKIGSQMLPTVLLGGLFAVLLSGGPRLRSRAALVLASLALAWLIARGIQVVAPMPRPFMLHLGTVWLAHASSAGFPSTHASVAVAFGTAVACVQSSRLVTGVALLLAAWVAWSRVCLGLHFPSDVAAAALVGVLGALLVVRAAELLGGVTARIRGALPQDGQGD